MLYRRRCPSSICIAVASLVFFAINLTIYLMVDNGPGRKSEFDPFKKDKFVAVADVKAAHIETIPGSKLKKQDTSHSRKFVVPPNGKPLSGSAKAKKRIVSVLNEISKRFKKRGEKYKLILKSVLDQLSVRDNLSVDLSLADKWANNSQIIPESAPELGNVLNKLCSSKIVGADNSKRGTQLKLLLTLQSGHKALFKPQWYERDAIVPGSVYAGKDRHNAEVAAFHLGLLLDFRRIPLTVGRRIDLRREVMPVATPALRETFFQEGNDTCFYGVCYYCAPTDPVCALRDIMEGALILWLPQTLTFARYTNPWQRSYKTNMVARWEIEEDYCTKVKTSKSYSLSESERLLDIVETAIFDFLISNGDRHHYEAPVNVPTAPIFLFDNGKSFGNPSEDYLDILAPLYQCCVLRQATWHRLLDFRGGALSSSLEETLKSSHIAPVLTRQHLEALDRRLNFVFAAVEICIREHSPVAVLL